MKLFECQNCGQPLYFENTRCESCGLRCSAICRGPRRVTRSGGGWRRAACDGRPEAAAIGIAPMRSHERVQLAGSGRESATALRGVPPQSHHPGFVAAGQSRELAPDRVRQASAVLYPAANSTCRSTTRVRIRDEDWLSIFSPTAARSRWQRAGDDRPRRRPDHDQPGRGGRLERERLRKPMHEPYRTLLGHFRHEVAHYYWDRLVSD